jgi:CRISPR-associated endoribonuclease Cas6
MCTGCCAPPCHRNTKFIEKALAMLISLILTLQSPKPALLPHHLGRANHAAVLAQLNRVDPLLGAQAHAGDDGPKPVTCSDLFGARMDRQGCHVGTGESYTVRVTGLTPSISQALHMAFIEAPPQEWTVTDHTFEVIGVTCDPHQHEWAGITTYEALAANELLQSGQPDRRVTLHFGSPTAFKSAGIQVPIPLPNLVFGSLVERWNSFSPVVLSPEMRRFGEEMIAISRYDLRSLPVSHKNGAMRIGGVGEVTYTALGNDRYWTAAMNMLADFALFSGVGVQTATGMGQVRRVQ